MTSYFNTNFITTSYIDNEDETNDGDQIINNNITNIYQTDCSNCQIWTEDVNGINYDGGNVGIGQTSDSNNKLSINGNTKILGSLDLQFNKGQDNIFVGVNAGSDFQQGNNNILLGSGAGYNFTNASDNIIIGTHSELEYNANNKLNIGDAIFGSGLYTGDIKIGIKSQNPETTLDISGDLKVSGGLKANNSFGNSGQVLKTDGNNIYWGDISNSSSIASTSKWVQYGSSIVPNSDIRHVCISGNLKFDQFNINEDTSSHVFKINQGETNLMKMEQYPISTTNNNDISQIITEFIRGDVGNGYTIEPITTIPKPDGLTNNQSSYNLHFRVSGYLAMKIGALQGSPNFPLKMIASDILWFRISDKFYNDIAVIPLKYPDYDINTGFFDISANFPSAIYQPENQFPLKYRITKWYVPTAGSPLSDYLQLEYNSTIDINIKWIQNGLKNKTTFSGDVIADDIYGNLHSTSLSNSFSNYAGSLTLGNTINFHTEDESLTVGTNTIVLDGKQNSIGIATKNPTHTLHINKNVSPAFRVGDFLYCDSLNNNLRLYGSIKTDHIKDKNNDIGGDNYVLGTDASGYTVWKEFDLSLNNYYRKSDLLTLDNSESKVSIIGSLDISTTKIYSAGPYLSNRLDILNNSNISVDISGDISTGSSVTFVSNTNNLSLPSSSISTNASRLSLNHTRNNLTFDKNINAAAITLTTDTLQTSQTSGSSFNSFLVVSVVPFSNTTHNLNEVLVCASYPAINCFTKNASNSTVNITNIRGFSSQFGQFPTGTTDLSGNICNITNLEHFTNSRYNRVGTTGGTTNITNFYGLRLIAPTNNNPTQTTIINNFGISVEDASAKNLIVGFLGLNTSSPTNQLDINSDTIRLRTARTIATSTTAGNQGEICWDANYVYVCVATNTWKRCALSTW